MKTIQSSQIILILIILLTPAFGSDYPVYDSEARFHPVVARNGMVVSRNGYATEAGIRVLKEGGNAIDAAVTVGFTLAVTYPSAGNLGGGGFMLVYLAEDNRVTSIDYREKAPLKASRNMFLDNTGGADHDMSRNSILSAGVPGTVAGLAYALEKYGTITLERALKPAIELAQKGFVVNEDLSRQLKGAKERMKGSRASMDIFYKRDESLYEAGDILVQEDLAWSLREIAENGPGAFYEDAVARKISDFMEENGGLITMDDLKSYKPAERKPVYGTYRGYEVYSMPPPSSGGVHLIQMLNILEQFPLAVSGHNTARTIHLLNESMKFAYADRSRHLGDPDFVSVPLEGLVSKQYAKELKNKIDMTRAKPSDEISPGKIEIREGEDTTHFSVMDKFGNAVSNTYTLNFSFGSKITVPGTGILLNNEMDDFSAKPGTPNAYGLVGGENNAIAPEKRMLSSMTPTIVLKKGVPFIVTGSPGGSRIITTVLQVVINVIDFGLNISEATNAVRVHHQWLPDELVAERGLSGDTVDMLKAMGHDVKIGRTIGNAQSIMRIGDYHYGASDPRGPGGLAAGY